MFLAIESYIERKEPVFWDTSKLLGVTEVDAIGLTMPDCFSVNILQPSMLLIFGWRKFKFS